MTKSVLTKTAVTLMAAAFTLGVAACSDDQDGTDDTGVSTSVELDSTSTTAGDDAGSSVEDTTDDSTDDSAVDEETSTTAG
jgi:hypothetical protein